MIPYYEAHGITLYRGDALDILPTLPRASVHMILADPPYGVEARATGFRAQELPLSRISGDESKEVGDAIIKASWSKLAHVRHAYVFGPFRLNGLQNAAGCCELIWDKVNPTMGNLDHPWGRQHEPIQFAIHGPKGRTGGKLARVRSGSVLRYLRPTGVAAKNHITEKPVSLLRQLIEMSSRHGETVLDPCTGSGSTLVAALLEGRKAIGIELETQWADRAVMRLQRLTQQGNLFAPDFSDAEL